MPQWRSAASSLASHSGDGGAWAAWINAPRRIDAGVSSRRAWLPIDTHTLPTGFDADAVLTREGRHAWLNIREAAIVPIAAIARWAAAVAGAGEGSTPERLRSAAEAAVIGDDQAQTLIEAFELALELRIVHHLERIAAGEAPDDLLDAAELRPLTRSRLRDVFRAVSAVARELAP